MKYWVVYLFFSLGTVILPSCQPAQLSAEELTTYVADPAHHLQQKQQVGDTEITVTYQPVDLLIARELPAPPYQQAHVDSLRAKYHGTMFLLLSLARNQHEILQPTEGFSTYSDLLQTLAFRMGERVQILTSQGDTLRPTTYYLDRTYASASATQLLFAFPKLPVTGSWQFRLQEFGLGVGNLSFPFESSVTSAMPTLAAVN